MQLARATAEDAGPLTDVWLRSRKASIPANPPPVYSDAEMLAFFTEVAVPVMETWVAVEDEVVGLLVLKDDFVNQLHVDPDHQRRGIGTALVELAQRRRPAGLELWTFQSNDVARRLYERHGFVPVEETSGDNVERAPDVRYTWRPSARPAGT